MSGDLAAVEGYGAVCAQIDAEAIADDTLDFVSVTSETGAEGEGSRFLADRLQREGFDIRYDDGDTLLIRALLQYKPSWAPYRPPEPKFPGLDNEEALRHGNGAAAPRRLGRAVAVELERAARATVAEAAAASFPAGERAR